MTRKNINFPYFLSLRAQETNSQKKRLFDALEEAGVQPICLELEDTSNAADVTVTSRIDTKFITDVAHQAKELVDNGRSSICAAWALVSQEVLPLFILRQWYPILLLLTVRRPIRRKELLPKSSSLAALSKTPDCANEQLKLLRDKSDALANLYAQKYRSSYVGRFLLSAVVAVLVAFMLLAFPNWQKAAYGIEFLTTVVIVASFVATKNGDWQRKWLSMRYISESLRTMMTLPQGAHLYFLRNRPFPEDVASDEECLVEWCARNVAMDWQKKGCPANEQPLEKLLNNQIGYHSARIVEQSKTEKRLGTIGLTAFCTSMFLACISLLGSFFWPQHVDHLKSLIALLLAILPAIGAALFAIRVQSNFKIEALQSQVTLNRLKSLAAATSVNGQPTNVLARYIRLQQSEFDEWRQLQQGRALDMP